MGASAGVEMDFRYEFDAPKFYDLTRVANNTETDSDASEDWFSKHNEGLVSPTKPSPPLKGDQIEDKEETDGWCLGAPGDDRQRKSSCGNISGGDAMDVDTPAPAPNPEATNRPVTRSQTKAESTKSRVLQPMSMNSAAMNSAKGPSSQSTVAAKTAGKLHEFGAHQTTAKKRRHQSSAAIRTAKPLTEPMDFEFQTAKRHRMTARSQTPLKEETPLPLAVQTQLFHTAKKDVYTENHSKALPQGRRAPLTNPKTPHLRSHARAQARKENLPSIAGAQQKPFREDEIQNKNRVGNLNRSKQDFASRNPLATSEAKNTTAQPANHQNLNKVGFVFNAKPGGPSTIKTTAAGGITKHAKGAAEIRKEPTKPQPFHFETEKRMASSLRSRTCDEPYQFRARPVPVSNHVKAHVKQQPRSLTIPESPALISKQRHAQYQEQYQRKLEEETRMQKEAANFKARSMPVTQPWMPQQVQHPLTVPQEPHFNLDDRAVKRSAFDRAQAERERVAQMERQALQAAEYEKRAEEIRQMRRNMVPKAKPVPDFSHPYHPKASTAPLTEAKTPNFHMKTRSAHSHMR